MSRIVLPSDSLAASLQPSGRYFNWDACAESTATPTAEDELWVRTVSSEAFRPFTNAIEVDMNIKAVGGILVGMIQRGSVPH